MLMLGGFLFGWAKPVPITWENLRHPKRDMAWVAAAGPLSNLVMALFWALFARLGLTIGNTSGELAMYMMYTGVAGIFINTILMLLNLLPKKQPSPFPRMAAWPTAKRSSRWRKRSSGSKKNCLR